MNKLENDKYLFYMEEKTKKKLFNMTIGTLCFPIIILLYFYLDKEVSIPFHNIPIMIVLSITVLLFYAYNIAELLHIVSYWQQPLILSEKGLEYLINAKDYKNIDLKSVYTIAIFKKRKIPNLIEFKDKDNNSLGTVYLKGFSYTDINKLFSLIKEEHKQIIFHS